MFPHRFPRIVLLCALLAAGVTTSVAGGSAGGADELYVGSLSADDLSWRQEADGTWTPLLTGARLLEEPGRPRLPMRSLLLVAPAGRAVGGVEIVALATRRVVAPGPLALAGLTDEPGRVRLGDGSIAGEAAAFPGAWGESGGTHLWRGLPLLGLRLLPVRAVRGADGTWSEVEILERYAVRALPGAAGAGRADGQAAGSAPARDLGRLATLVANPEALSGWLAADAGGAVAAEAAAREVVVGLIITPQALAAQFQRLADYHSANGVPTLVRTVEWIVANSPPGRDLPETIRQYLQGAYATWGLQTLLIGGNTAAVPTRFVFSTYYPPMSGTYIPADLYYGCLDGTWDANGNGLFAEPYSSYLYPGDDADLAAELAVGRAPVGDAAEAAVFVDKTIAYLQPLPGAPWLGRALLAAEVLFPTAYVPGTPITLDGASFTQTLVNNVFTPCTSLGVTRLYEASQLWPGSLRETRAAFRDTLNAGTTASSCTSGPATGVACRSATPSSRTRMPRP